MRSLSIVWTLSNGSKEKSRQEPDMGNANKPASSVTSIGSYGHQGGLRHPVEILKFSEVCLWRCLKNPAVQAWNLDFQQRAYTNPNVPASQNFELESLYMREKTNTDTNQG